MTRLRPALGALLAALLLAAACSGSTPDPEPLPVAAPDAPVLPDPSEFTAEGEVPESYLLKQIHTAWVKAQYPMWEKLWIGKGKLASIDTDDWVTDRVIRVHTECQAESHYTIHTLSFWFKDLGYDPELSNLSFGDTKIVSSQPADLDGSARLYDLTHEDDPATFSETQSFSLEQDRSVSFAKTIEMDVTIGNETKVGGTIAGVGAEDTISTSFGYKNTQEYSQSQSESTARSESYEFDVDLPPGKATLITAQAQDIDSATPMTGEMVASWKPEVWITDAPCGSDYSGQEPRSDYSDWYNGGPLYLNQKSNKKWCHGKDDYDDETSPSTAVINKVIHHGGCTFYFDNVDAIKTFIEGKDVNWPGMEQQGQGWRAWNCKHDCWEAQNTTLNKTDIRHLTLDATQHRRYQDAIQQKVEDVTGQDLGALAAKHGIEVQHDPPRSNSADALTGFVENDPAPAVSIEGLPFVVGEDGIFVYHHGAGVIRKYTVAGDREDEFEIAVRE